jgi:uncharacterized protein YaaQ
MVGTEGEPVKKMVMAVVPREQADRTLDALVAARFTATYGESHGGVLRQAQDTLFIAVDETELDPVLTIIRENCRPKPQNSTSATQSLYSLGPVPVTAELGGAVVFVWTIDQIETY